jgi:hypothetical protein
MDPSTREAPKPGIPKPTRLIAQHSNNEGCGLTRLNKEGPEITPPKYCQCQDSQSNTAQHNPQAHKTPVVNLQNLVSLLSLQET